MVKHRHHFEHERANWERRERASTYAERIMRCQIGMFKMCRFIMNSKMLRKCTLYWPYCTMELKFYHWVWNLG